MSNLTIAQALRRVKKLKGSIAEHTKRAAGGVSYLSTNVPAFRFKEEVAALSADKEEMVDLESRIAVANATHSVLDGTETVTLTKAIRRLQELKGNIAFLNGLFINTSTQRVREQEWNDVTNTYVTKFVEQTFVSDLSEVERDQQVKALQDRFETLNNAVEDANHRVTV